MQMDPADIPGGVDPIPNTPCMDGSKVQTRSQSPPQLQAADPVSRVLDDDNLLIEIIVRLGLPTTLIRAILVCKRWFYLVSGKAFLHRFRSLHPPRLLGFYVSTRSTDHIPLRPRFVPMLPQPPELAAAVRLAENYSLDAYEEEFACIYECQNDTILLHAFQGKGMLFGLHWPLCPERGIVAPPVTPRDQFDGTAGTAANFLVKDDGDSRSLTYIWLSMGYLIEGKKYSIKYKAHIYMLQDGLWRWRSSAAALLPFPRSNDLKPLLSGSKIYMEHSTSIAALDLTTSSFSTIPLPEGMEQFVCRDMILSQANDSGFYLIHLEKLQLHIWLHRGDNSGSMRNWFLLDTICLREMLDALGMVDGEQPTLFNTSQMGDNLQFVFLKIGQCALYLDIKRRELCKVYEVTEDNRTLDRIYPFMMTWPPTFPVLKNDPASRNRAVI